MKMKGTKVEQIICLEEGAGGADSGMKRVVYLDVLHKDHDEVNPKSLQCGNI
jgi:hypothetical protein